MANENTDGKWFARLAVGFMFTALSIMGMALWNVSARANEQVAADIKAVEKHIAEKVETKESHNKDMQTVKVQFEFIAQQLKEIKEAVKK